MSKDKFHRIAYDPTNIDFFRLFAVVVVVAAQGMCQSSPVVRSNQASSVCVQTVLTNYSSVLEAHDSITFESLTNPEKIIETELIKTCARPHRDVYPSFTVRRRLGKTFASFRSTSRQSLTGQREIHC